MPTDNEIIAIATRRLQKARTQMLTTQMNGRYPFIFWATAALQLRLKPLVGMLQSGAGGAIGTDGTSIVFDPHYIADPALTEPQLVALAAHEVSHCCKGDLWRRGDRDPRTWNIAADMRIDPELIAVGLEPPPHGSPEFNALFRNPKNNGRSAEEIYKELIINPPPCLQQSNGTMDGDIMDPTDPTAGTKDPSEKRRILEDLERKWGIIARQAAEHAKAQGHLPLGYQHLVEPIKPKLNPWELIRHYVSMCRKDDFSWARPNRRALWRGLCLPSLHSEGIGEILIGIDTSGSCAGLIPIFLGFLGSVLSEVKPERTVLMECDYDVHAVTEFAAGDELPAQVPVHGYGGTRLAPIWEKAEEMGLEPICAIILTDLEMTAADFGDPQPFPVLWLSSEDGEAPWGQTAYLPSAGSHA